MKVKPHHYELIKAQIKKVVADLGDDLPAFRKHAEETALKDGEMRYRWNLWNVCYKIDNVNHCNLVNELYNRENNYYDAHVDTALKNVVKELDI